MIFPPTLYKVQILAKNEDKQEIIRQLHKLGVLHIITTKKEHGLQTDTSLQGTNEISKKLLQLRYIAEQTNTVQKRPVNKMPSVQKALSQAQPFIEKYLPEVEELRNQEQEQQKRIDRFESQLETLKALPFEITNTKTHTTLVYKSTKPVQIRIKNAQVHTEKTKEAHYTKITLANEHVEQLQQATSNTPLKKINTNFIVTNSKDAQTRIQEQLKQAQEKLQNLQTQKRALLEADKGTLRYLITSLENHYEAYTIANKFAKTQELFVITGYCEKHELQDIKEVLPETIIHAKKAGKNAPTKLKNNKVAAYYEPLTQLFSTPKYAAVDPTILVSIFFPIFFGLMFADIGYGLLTLAILPLVKQYTQKKWPVRILFISSISTIFFGAVFGSFFGELIPITPLYASSFDATMSILLASIAIGLVHMNTGVVLAIIQGFKQNNKKHAILNALPFFMIQATAISYYLANITLGHILAATTIALLIYNNGLFGIMDISGHIGAIFSYARILALGLATAGVALAVNTIADKVATLGAIGILLWLFITVIGHAFNFVVSIIGISINSARLHYVEFFSLFFDGGGELFEAFTRKKYTEVQ